LPILIAFTGLSVEVGHWYLKQREMQGAADASAISAAADYVNFLNGGSGSTSATYQSVGVTYAGDNGFVIPQSDVCLITTVGNNCDSSHPTPIDCPLGSGTPPVAACVVVDIAQAQTHTLLLPSSLPLIGSISEPTLKARAVVAVRNTTTVKQTPGNGCLLALKTSETNGNPGLNFSGNAQFTGNNCTIASNSKPASITAPTGGKSNLTATGAILARTTAFTCSAPHCNIPTIVTSSPTIPDPYAGRTFGTAPTAPATSSFTVTNITRSGTTATATVASTAALFTGQTVAISGATGTSTPYNGTFTITVNSSTTFTYTVSGSPPTPAKGTLTLNICPVFTSGTNAGGGSAQHMQCYSGGTTSGTTTFSPLHGLQGRSDDRQHDDV
jgi:hypothetical protein